MTIEQRPGETQGEPIHRTLGGEDKGTLIGLGNLHPIPDHILLLGSQPSHGEGLVELSEAMHTGPSKMDRS